MNCHRTSNAGTLPPGRWRIAWQEQKYGSERLTVLDELVIPSATLVEIGL